MSESVRLVDVRILGMPVDVYREASEHGDELLREFALVRGRQGDRQTQDHEVPARLLRLAERLGTEFRDFTTSQDNQLRDAVERGDTCIDLHYRVPAAVRAACVELDELLDEADEFCRQGQEMLTLATPPQAVAFRRWFLDQFIRQVDGLPPTPWAPDAGPEASG